MSARLPEIIYHAASSGSGAVPNSLPALRDCIDAGASFVEIDILPLQGGDFALLHDARLESATSGSGNAAGATAAQVLGMFYKREGLVTDVPVTLLSQVVALLAESDALLRLQLDLKPYAPLTPDTLTMLAHMVAPVRERVQVSSVADWAVRLLRRIDPELSLGFDPLLYLDMETSQPRPPGVPPFRVGAYGLRDDHPLASDRWGTDGDYFAARAEALLAQAPPGVTWYIRAALLLRALQAGFDWIAYLHASGCRVGAWTLDAVDADQVAWARQLAEAGVDAITSNTPAQMTQALASRA